MKTIFTTIALTFTLSAAFAQGGSGYIKSGSIGEVKPQDSKPVITNSDKFEDDIPYRRLDDTKGMKWMLLPLEPILGDRFKEYTGLRLDGPGNSSKKQLLIKEWAGKFLTLTDADSEYAHFVDSAGNKYEGFLFKGQLAHMVLVDDIDRARKLYLNKTFYLKTDEIDTYDAINKKNGKIKNLKFDPVKIIDIVSSYDINTPIRFIMNLQNGKTGYLDLVVSGTNSDQFYIDKYSLDKIFYKVNPKITYKLTPKMWAQVKEGAPVLGINKTQLKLMIGEPSQVNIVIIGGKKYEDFVYTTYRYESYLFLNGKLCMIKN